LGKKRSDPRIGEAMGRTMIRRKKSKGRSLERTKLFLNAKNGDSPIGRRVHERSEVDGDGAVRNLYKTKNF